MKNKNDVLYDFNKMIEISWTYGKLTKEEKDTYNHIFNYSSQAIEAVKGTYEQRWKILQAFYSIFLAGIGYTGWNWRSEKKEKQPF